MRRSIDQIRDYLFGGGYPDPVSNAEQLSFLFFFYLVAGIDAENALKAKVMKQPYESLFAGEWTLKNPLNASVRPERSAESHPVRPERSTASHPNHPERSTAPHSVRPERSAEGAESKGLTIPRDRFRWSVWAKGLSGEALVRFVRDEVFPFFAELGEQAAYNFMHGARLTIDEPTVLTQVVALVDGLRLDQSDADTKGDLFEHVLRQIKQAGELGQFRTPRHVIRAIVELIDPQVGETIYDPAAGTAGFLVAAYNHIRLANSSPAAIQEVEMDACPEQGRRGKMQKRGLGDKLSAAQVSALATATFYGNDVDPKMVRLATMNLTLRGLPNVRILLRNVLTTTLDNERKRELGLPQEGYHVVLANPPFSGRVDKDRIVDDVKVGTTTATELLFLKYMLDSLRPGGRCGVIVPEGVLFGGTGAHKELRRQLIENNQVEAVLSLPGGVFQPYSGVKTSVLIFRKPLTPTHPERSTDTHPVRPERSTASHPNHPEPSRLLKFTA
jgi:type I restriction enzyme M protein